MLCLMLFEAFGTLKNMFIIFFVTIITKILKIVSRMNSTFNFHCTLPHTSIVTSYRLDGIFLRMPIWIGNSFLHIIILFFQRYLWFLINILRSNIHILVLFCHTNDQMSDIIGESLFSACWTNNSIFDFELTTWKIAYFYVSTVIILDAQLKHGWC